MTLYELVEERPNFRSFLVSGSEDFRQISDLVLNALRLPGIGARCESGTLVEITGQLQEWHWRKSPGRWRVEAKFDPHWPEKLFGDGI
jgi:hypothetical protein